MTSLDNGERKFYQDTIVNLLQYNGQLISALITRGGMPPIPGSFGIEVNLDDMKKLQSAWRDSPMNPTKFASPAINKMMDEMFRKMSGVDDDKEDPLK